MRARAAASLVVIVSLAVAARFAVRAMLEPEPAPVAAPAPAAPVVAPEGYASALSDLARRRAHAETQAASSERVASRWTQAASLQLTYARLTGDYAAYASAEKSLERAFTIMRSYVDDPNAGPLMMKAKLDFELHRMAPALEALPPIERQAEKTHDTALLAEARSLRGAVTFSLGRYDEGLALLREAVAMGGDSHKQRLAIALEKVGELEEARAIWDETVQSSSGQGRAWALYQRGRMHLTHGRLGDARADLEGATALFPGFWLFEEHVAQLDAEEGRSDEAIAAYRSLIERTGNPEHMDALAALVGGEEAAALLARARKVHEERLRTLPEASYGHALDHYLAHGDPSFALELAQKNKALRPDGEAMTKLAQAYLKLGKNAEAKAEMEAVLATDWDRVDSWATAAVAFHATGDEQAAASAAAEAAELNPRASSLDWAIAHVGHSH